MLTTYITKMLSYWSQDSRLRAIGLTSLGSAFTRGIQVLVGIISVPLALTYLGDERYGLMTTIISFVGIISFSELGLGMGLQNKIPELSLDGNLSKFKAYTSTTFFLLCLVATILLITFLIIYNLVAWDSFFNIRTYYKREAELSVLFFFITFIIGMPFALVQRLQDGFQQGYFNQVWLSLGSLLGLIGLYVSTKLSLNTPYIILAIYGANTLMVICNFLYHFIKVRPYLFPSFKSVDFNIVGNLFTGGIFFFIVQFTNIIFQSIDPLILAQTLGIKEVTIYSIGSKLVSVMILPVQIIVPSYLPAFNEAIMKNDKFWIKRMLNNSFKLGFLISSFSACFIYFFSDWLVHIWISPNFDISSNLKLSICAYVFLMNYNYLFSYIGLTSKFIRTTAIYYAITIIITILLKYNLLPLLGTSGLFWITIISFPIFYFLPIFIQLKRNKFA